MARMALNQSVRTTDPGAILQNETGYFNLTSPGGEQFQVACQGGHSLSSITSENNGPWTLQKIGELVEQTKQPRAGG